MNGVAADERNMVLVFDIYLGGREGEDMRVM